MVTYWLFGGLVTALLSQLSNYVDSQFSAVGSEAVVYWAFYLGFFGYLVFIWIAIWRSAGKYEGAQTYSTLARLMVVVGVVALVGAFAEGLSSEPSLQEEVDAANLGLPTMIDEETELVRVSLSDEALTYVYNLVTLSASELDPIAVGDILRPDLRAGYCADDWLRGLMSAGRDIQASYRDRVGEPVVTISIAIADCDPG